MALPFRIDRPVQHVALVEEAAGEEAVGLPADVLAQPDGILGLGFDVAGLEQEGLAEDLEDVGQLKLPAISHVRCGRGFIGPMR